MQGTFVSSDINQISEDKVFPLLVAIWQREICIKTDKSYKPEERLPKKHPSGVW